MAHLFKVESNVVFPNEETLLIYPYKDIWERDTSKGKELALKELAYIEFMSSLLATNPYSGYTEDLRKEVIVKDIFKGEVWSPDELVLAGVEHIKDFQTKASPSYRSYQSAMLANDKINEFFKTVDLTRTNYKTGLPIYKPKEITSALLDVDKVTASLDSLRKKVEEELFEAVKVKGQKEISPFAKTQ